MRPPSEAIGQLALVVGVIASLILIGVEAAIAAAIWRYRSRGETALPPQVHGNTRLEIAWTVAPLLTLAVVAALMVGVMREVGASTASGSGPASLTVEVIGHQYWWEYRYPPDIVAANELHIPAGEPVDLRLSTRDVIHSFWVPALAGKADLIPNKVNVLRLYATRPGVYQGQCAEYCGIEHAWMRIRVVAQPRPEFDAWLSAQRRPAAAPAGLAAQGQRLFGEKVCVSCHTVRGAAAGDPSFGGFAGTGGPDLTHFGSRDTIGAGVLPNDEAHLREWLARTQYWKPGALMPTVPLSDAELDALVAYLGSLR